MLTRTARTESAAGAWRLDARPRLARVGWWALGLAAISLAGLAIRLPLFADVPGYTDETGEVLLGLAIARGEALPLTNMANYIGPGWSYLLALVFLVIGPGPDTARALMVVAGSACVPLCGWLAWRGGGPLAALVAAGLMATSAMAVLLGSHVAWSVCLVPLLVGLTVALLLRALERPSGGRLAAAALAYGLALHAHPVAGAAGPGLLAGLLLAPAGRRLLASARRLLLAALVVALPQAPVALDVLVGNRFLRQLEGHLHRTTFAPTLDPAEIAARLPPLLVQVQRLIASSLEGSAHLEAFLLQPRFALFTLWLLGGLVVAGRRRQWLLVLPPLSYALLWPVVEPNYDLFYESRYSLLVLPLLYAAMGLAAAALLGAIRRVPAGGGAVAAAAGVVVVALVLWPLVDLDRYVQRQVESGRSNQVARAALALADRQGGRETPLLLEHALTKPGINSGGTYLDWLSFRRALRGAPARVVDLNDRGQVVELAREGSPRILLLGRARQVEALNGSYELREVGRFARGSAAFSLYVGTRRR